MNQKTTFTMKFTLAEMLELKRAVLDRYDKLFNIAQLSEASEREFGPLVQIQNDIYEQIIKELAVTEIEKQTYERNLKETSK